MTLIEFFSMTPVENLLSALALRPDKIVYVSPESRKVIRAIPIYQKILEGRGIFTEMRVKSISKNDLEAVVAALYDILSDPSDDYVIDISGGDEGALVAFGIVLGGTSLRVSAFRMNAVSRRGVWFRFLDDGRRKIERTVLDFSGRSQVCLNVRENVLLHGGRIYSESCAFSREDPVCEDIEKLWAICRRDCAGWNAKINRFSASVRSFAGEQGLSSLPDDVLGRKGGVDRELWQSLVGGGFLLIDETASYNGVTLFRYKNKPVQDCLTKAGSLFEYYTYKTALECEQNGEPVFDSVATGVVLGWKDDANSTRNEIDVMLMAGLTPVFLSCKNGEVGTDELYKLNTVAEKFGAGRARCALAVTSFFDPQDRSYGGDAAVGSMKGRADDMKIRILGAVNRMSDAEFSDALASLMN